MFIDRFVKIVQRLLERKFIILPLLSEGVIRNGHFTPYDMSTHDLVNTATHLVIEKGKYRILPKNPGLMDHDRNEPVGMRVIDNSMDSYDRFWADAEVLDTYLCESRLQFYNSVYTLCKAHLRGKIVDIGCGSGDLLKVIDEHIPDADLQGFDFSTSAVQRCRSIIPRGAFSSGDAYSTHYGDALFDTVLCIEVLEHLEDPSSALTELVRICKPDGTIILSVPNGIYDSYVGHLHFWSEADFRLLLSGLDVIESHYLENNRTMLFVARKRP